MRPILTHTASDGTVCVLIQLIEYTYHMDAALIPMVKRLFRYSPWKAVNMLKERAYSYSKQQFKRRDNMIETTKGVNHDMQAGVKEMYLGMCQNGHAKDEITCSHCKHVFCMSCSPSWSGQGGSHIECPNCGHYEEF